MGFAVSGLNPVHTTLAENVAWLRKAKGWTQADLAEKIQKSNATISKIESASSWLSPDVLLDLAIALEVTVPELFDDSLNKSHKISRQAKVSLSEAFKVLEREMKNVVTKKRISKKRCS